MARLAPGAFRRRRSAVRGLGGLSGRSGRILARGFCGRNQSWVMARWQAVASGQLHVAGPAWACLRNGRRACERREPLARTPAGGVVGQGQRGKEKEKKSEKKKRKKGEKGKRQKKRHKGNEKKKKRKMRRWTTREENTFGRRGLCTADAQLVGAMSGKCREGVALHCRCRAACGPQQGLGKGKYDLGTAICTLAGFSLVCVLRTGPAVRGMRDAEDNFRRGVLCVCVCVCVCVRVCVC